MAEDTDSVGNQTESAETPNEAYKSLQRKLEASRRRERALMEQNLAQVEIQAQLEALTNGNQAMLRVLEKQGLIDDEDLPQAQRGTRVPPDASSARREIAQNLFEAETSWDDPSMDNARNAWASGRFKEAAEMVATTLGSTDSATSEIVEAEVERRLASRAGASMVDSEGTTSVVPTGLLTDASRLNNTLAGPEGREFWTEHKDEILKNLRGGKISLPA